MTATEVHDYEADLLAALERAVLRGINRDVLVGRAARVLKLIDRLMPLPGEEN